LTRYFAGIDIGSTMTKVAITDGVVIATVIGPTGPEHRRMAHRVMQEALDKAGLAFADLSLVVATGYGRINVPFADRQITEISCHARGISHLLPAASTVIDIGGQDSKAISLVGGRPVNFVMNDRCAAGTGRFLEVTAESLGIRLDDLGPLSLEAKGKVEIGSTCAVFAVQEVVSSLSAGASIPDIIAGLHESIAARILGMARRLKIVREVAMTGGGAKDAGLVQAIEAKLGFKVLIPPEPLLTGALGAAMLGRDIFDKAAASGQPIVRSERHLEAARLFS
jgi:predicted CoA-substrate-specific enzyme activase